jgi:hypothetical protein
MALPEALKKQLVVELGPEGSTQGLRLLDDMSVVRRPFPIFPSPTLLPRPSFSSLYIFSIAVCANLHFLAQINFEPLHRPGMGLFAGWAGQARSHDKRVLLSMCKLATDARGHHRLQLILTVVHGVTYDCLSLWAILSVTQIWSRHAYWACQKKKLGEFSGATSCRCECTSST